MVEQEHQLLNILLVLEFVKILGEFGIETAVDCVHIPMGLLVG